MISLCLTYFRRKCRKVAFFDISHDKHFFFGRIGEVHSTRLNRLTFLFLQNKILAVPVGVQDLIHFAEGIHRRGLQDLRKTYSCLCGKN
jgi:hypothetical protein